jgi:hypothetical protein
MSTKDVAALVAENLKLHAELAELRGQVAAWVGQAYDEGVDEGRRLEAIRLGKRFPITVGAWVKTAYRACQRVFRPRLGR